MKTLEDRLPLASDRTVTIAATLMRGGAESTMVAALALSAAQDAFDAGHRAGMVKGAVRSFLVFLVLLALALAAGCGAPVVYDTHPRPGQQEAVRVALAAYGAEGTPRFAWITEGELLCDGDGVRVEGYGCMGGYFEDHGRVIVLPWPEGTRSVRDGDLPRRLAHELRHWARPDEDCPPGDYAACHTHEDFAPGGVVDQVAAVIRGTP